MRHAVPSSKRCAPSRSGLLTGAVVALLLAACEADDDAEPDVPDPGTEEQPEPDGDPDEGALEEAPDTTSLEQTEAERLEGITTASAYGDFLAASLDPWQDAVPDIEDITITSTEDGHEQPALWLPPAEDGRPLLVVLHTWSTEYLQHISVPFGEWADAHGWGFIHPNFRGSNDNPEATSSPLAIQDVVDAVDFAVEEGGVDPDHVYVLGFSGGGMLALTMVGLHPDVFAGAVAWAPNYSLEDWYAFTAEEHADEDYDDWIAASCTGDPTSDEGAQQECHERSPEAHLDGAREAEVPVYIAHGLQDDLVPPDHGLRAFDHLADEDDRLGDDVIDRSREYELPDDLLGSVEADTFFAEEDPEVLFARSSGPVTIVVFEGDHDMAYHPGLEWIVEGAPAQR